MKHVHILGICGTFMAGIAQLAKALGYHVTGSDENIYPPMSTQLAASGIEVTPSHDLRQFHPKPEEVVIGNALSRGHVSVEWVLRERLPYTSGPEWLYRHLLKDRWVLAVAGTHGKTTTTGLLTWIFEFAGLNPGFLIGGVPQQFKESARLGEGPFFILEADEYDTAFFDKRSKFLHYRPKTLILNNLEYDHSDIFPDLASIQRQMHYLVRTVPDDGVIIRGEDKALEEVMAQGVWTPQQVLHQDWQARNVEKDGSAFEVFFQGKNWGRLEWSLLGMHNVHNALAALAAAHHGGIPIEKAMEALAFFQGIKRRLEVRGVAGGVTVYDDFAHHPTAIHTTLKGLREKVGTAPIVAVLDFASYTMRNGDHQHTVGSAVAPANEVYFAKPSSCAWPIESLANDQIQVKGDVQSIIDDIVKRAKPGAHVVIMSNRGFEGIHERLLEALNH